MYRSTHRYLGRRKRGFTLPEMLISTSLVVFLVATVFLLMSNAQGAFFNADASIDIRNQVRQAFKKISIELRQTGFDSSATAQFTIADAVGVNATDTITFSIPVLCTSSMTNILDSNGDPDYWGASLTWGCTTSSCMDADNNCATVDYKYIRYLIDADNNLVRQVLSNSSQLVDSSIIAEDISDFQISTPAGGNGRVLVVTITAQKQAVTKRVVTCMVTQRILVSNYGT